MRKSPAAKRFWRMVGPLLLCWFINFVVKLFAEVIVLFPHVPELLESAFPAGVPSKADSVQLATLYSEKAIAILLPYQVFIMTAGALATVPLTVYLFWKDKQAKKRSPVFNRKRTGVLAYAKITGFGVAVCVGMNCLTFMVGLALIGGEYSQEFQALYSADFLQELICLGVLIPISEELLYRGVLYTRFREIASFSRSAVFVSLLFGLSHGYTVQIIYAFIIGIFLAYLYEKFDSLSAPALLHVVVNVTSVILTELGGFENLAKDLVKMAFVTILCAFFGSLLFVSIQRARKKTDFPQTPLIK